MHDRPKVKYDPDIHHRRSIRLKGYDYRLEGAYFVTICSQERARLFGEVVDGAMQLNEAGKMVITAWEALPARFPTIDLDAFVVMPNHAHGIIVLDARLTETASMPALSEVVGAFKSIVTHNYVTGVRARGWPPFPGRLWQRSYYERIIRNDREIEAIRRYIEDNPKNWESDPEYTQPGVR